MLQDCQTFRGSQSKCQSSTFRVESSEKSIIHRYTPNIKRHFRGQLALLGISVLKVCLREGNSAVLPIRSRDISRCSEALQPTCTRSDCQRQSKSPQRKLVGEVGTHEGRSIYIRIDTSVPSSWLASLFSRANTELFATFISADENARDAIPLKVFTSCTLLMSIIWRFARQRNCTFFILQFW